MKSRPQIPSLSRSRLPFPPTSTFTSSGGFTLVELLIVMAVLVILASLLLPALSRGRSTAHRVSCLNNLRQWGQATHLYTTDHDDFLPPEGFANPGRNHTNTGWYVALPRQLGLPPYHTTPWHTNASGSLPTTPWLCPANPRRSNGLNLFHYALNSFVDGTGKEDHPVRLSAVPQPSRLVWLFDTKNLPAVGGWTFAHTNLHQAGAQFLFVDGHVMRFHHRAYWSDPSGKAIPVNPHLLWIP